MKYTPERIEQLIITQVVFWRYDKADDVMVNKWTIRNHGDFGIQPKPECNTREEAENLLRTTLNNQK